MKNRTAGDEMNIRSLLLNTFSVLFVGSFLIVLSLSVFKPLVGFALDDMEPLVYSNYSALRTAAGAVGFIFLLLLIKRKLNSLNQKKLSVIVIGLFLCLVVLQLITIFGARFIAYSDAANVLNEAIHFAETGSRSTGNYFDINPNNIAITIFQYWLIRLSNLFSVNYHYIFACVLMICLNLPIWLLGDILKKKINQQTQCLFILMCLLFMPLYTYLLFMYTDQLALLFLVLSFYFITNYFEKPAYYLIVLSSVCLALSVWFKMNTVIFLIAVCVIFLIHLPVKRGIIAAIMFCVIFSGTYLSTNVIETNHGYDRNNLSVKKPMTHFIKMGLNFETEGQYSGEDTKKTLSAGTYEEKKAENIAEIKRRLTENSPAELGSHFLKKIRKNWTVGNMEQYNLVRQYAQSNRLTKVYHSQSSAVSVNFINQMIYAALLVLLLIAYLPTRLNKRHAFLDLMGVTIFGVFLFHTFLWEVRPRYMYVILLFLVCSSAVGMNTLDKTIEKRLVDKHRKASKTALSLGVLLFILPAGHLLAGHIRQNDAFKTVTINQMNSGNHFTMSANDIIEQTFSAADPFNQIVLDQHIIAANSAIKITLTDHKKNKVKETIIANSGTSEKRIDTLAFEQLLQDGSYTLKLENLRGKTKLSFSAPFYDKFYKTPPLEINHKRINNSLLTMKVTD